MSENVRRPVSHTRELRERLARVWEGLERGTVSAADAKAFSSLSGAIIDAARFDLELMEVANAIGPLPLEPIVGPVVEAQSYLAIERKDDVPIYRERVVQLLSDRGAMKKADIASELAVPARKLTQVLDHEWFEKTPRGYRMSESC